MATSQNPERILSWFSCGAASAVATKKAIELYPDREVIPVCCDTRPSEHPDNYRFSAECERWFGRNIVFINSTEYVTIDDVFARTRYMSGVRGARCTTELKKIPRMRFANPEDTHVFGFTSDESRRIKDFEQRNPDMLLLWPLRDLGITKSRCYEIIRLAGIKLPEMYALGFDNNNCPGCVKASSPWYWNQVRKHFPEVFTRRAIQSRLIGCKLVQIRHHERIFLDELPDRTFRKRGGENISCGPECGMQLQMIYG